MKVATPVNEIRPASVSVIICAYDAKRWPRLQAAVESAIEQTFPPREVIVCVDHNDALLAQSRAQFEGEVNGTRILVIANQFDGRLGAARNSAALKASGDILAFLDDDGIADPTWLANLVAPYALVDVVAVGGAPRPDFERARPRWYPTQFDWIFGCAYTGLPTKLAPLRHLIGANMSVRREALAEIGGFHADRLDDMDMCHRLSARWPTYRLMYQPTATILHHVPAERLSWSYFWRRCFYENRTKATVLAKMGESRNLSAERHFFVQTMTRGLATEARALSRGDVASIGRAGAMITGFGAAATGYAVGLMGVNLRRGR